jgi:hypothetical protein
MKFDLICAIASGQPDPLILPFLSDELTCSHLLLFVSKWSKSKNIDENIRRALSSRGIKVTSVELPSEMWSDIQSVIETTLAEYPNQQVAFSGNGGTKPMTLAAYEYCYNDDIPMFYVDGHKLSWLYSANNQQLKTIDIEHSLPVEGYLLSHGYEVISQSAPLSSAACKDMIKDWVAGDKKEAIGTLNYIASRGNERNLTIALERNEASTGNPVCSLLDDLSRVGLIEFVTDEKIRFISEEARFFANGGWYELYICMLLQAVNKKHFSGKGKVITSLKVRPLQKTKKEIKNEIDVAYLLNNRLYLFECKTANLSSKNGRADEAIYKLGTLLSSVGGLHAKGSIMSYRDIDLIDKERAQLLNISIVDHNRNPDSMQNKLFNLIK